MAVIIVLFSVNIFKSFGKRAFWLIEHFGSSLSRQELSSDQTMDFLQQFLSFDRINLLGNGWHQISKLRSHFWSACFWYDGQPYICSPVCTTKKYFFGNLRGHAAGNFVTRNIHDVCPIRRVNNSDGGFPYKSSLPRRRAPLPPKDIDYASGNFLPTV